MTWFFPEKHFENGTEYPFVTDGSNNSSEAENLGISRKYDIWIWSRLPIHICAMLLGIIIKRKHLYTWSMGLETEFYPFGNSHFVTRSEHFLERFPFLEGTTEELRIYRIVRSVDLFFSAFREIDYFHEEFRMIPEKVEHREEFLYPNQTYLVFLGKDAMYADLVDIIDEPRRIHEASSIVEFSFLFLIVFRGKHPSGSDLESATDSSV